MSGTLKFSSEMLDWGPWGPGVGPPTLSCSLFYRTNPLVCIHRNIFFGILNTTKGFFPVLLCLAKSCSVKAQFSRLTSKCCLHHYLNLRRLSQLPLEPQYTVGVPQSHVHPLYRRGLFSHCSEQLLHFSYNDLRSFELLLHILLISPWYKSQCLIEECLTFPKLLH